MDHQIIMHLFDRVYQKACYYNALLTLALAPTGSVYVEGAAVSRITMSDGSVFNLVMDHGWVETPEGEIWDITDTVFGLNCFEYHPWLKLTPKQLIAAKVINRDGEPKQMMVRELLIEGKLFAVWFGDKGADMRAEVMRVKSDTMQALWAKYRT